MSEWDLEVDFVSVGAGVRLTFVGVGQNNGALLTDADGRVVHARGHAIPGLYAAGKAAARGYQSGMANARGMTFGYLAAKHAAERVASSQRRCRRRARAPDARCTLWM